VDFGGVIVRVEVNGNEQKVCLWHDRTIYGETQSSSVYRLVCLHTFSCHHLTTERWICTEKSGRKIYTAKRNDYISQDIVSESVPLEEPLARYTPLSLPLPLPPPLLPLIGS
jgi:hypothetical protein